MNAALEVLIAGPRTTVQDTGRPGYAHLGVPPAGAVDRHALAGANALAGNPAGTAALEVTLGGLRLRASEDVVIGLAGADVGLPLDRPVRVPAGKTITLRRPAEGVYTYLAVRGGIDVPAVLGSRSTDTLSGIGPRMLADGQLLAIGTPMGHAEPPPDPRLPAARTGTTVGLRVHPGPHLRGRGPTVLDALLEATWQVSPATDRTAVRLRGEVALPGGGEIDSEGLVEGAIQLPPDGQPIVLLANHPVTGGYPVFGVVASGELSRLVQLRPGRSVRFRATGS